jgi:hypothetical protein
MAEFFCSDVHQEIFAIRILAIKSLDRVLHCRSKLAIGPSELLEQHVPEPGIRLVHADCIHEFFDMMVHGFLDRSVRGVRR